MARKKPTFPRYCKQKRARGVADAYVEIEGHRFYLGRHGSPESWEKYTRLRAEWAASGNRLAVELQEGGVLAMAEHARKNDRRKALFGGVVEGDRVIEGLAREGHFVLGRSQLLRELLHVLARSEIGIRLRERQ